MGELERVASLYEAELDHMRARCRGHLEQRMAVEKERAALMLAHMRLGMVKIIPDNADLSNDEARARALEVCRG